MTNSNTAVPSAVLDQNKITLTFQLIRNTTSPDEIETGVKSYVLNLPAKEILKLNTKENLRSYIAEYNPRKRNDVHRAIRQTIETNPKRFITKNSGFVIVASDAVIDDTKKTATLENPSIINGAQSQGEIRKFWEELSQEGVTISDDSTPLFFVRAELIVDTDQDEVVGIAIARNTATPIKSISQAGAKDQLVDLAKSINEMFPEIKIQTKESDSLDEYYDTRKILQYARLLMPEDIARNSAAAERLRAYKNPEQCLQDFSDWFSNRDNSEKKQKYEFTVQIAPYAIAEYDYWAKHEGWNGLHLWEETKEGGRACRRDKRTQKITWVAPGLLYPILGAMSEFTKLDKTGRWILEKPTLFNPEEMLKMAIDQFRALEKDPMQMGRSESAYKALRIYPSTLMKILKSQSK